MTGPNGKKAYGDVAPLPYWSIESLEDANWQIARKKQEILAKNWKESTCLEQIKELNLYPSVSFALESALLSLLNPLPEHKVVISALFLGPPEEIIKQAEKRLEEGYVSAKLKVGHLSFAEAKKLILQLKDLFRLRIDVNRAWTTKESLDFFSFFDLDAFDYIEEPFQNPQDLMQFTHPLAIDESFPKDLSLRELEKLPHLKALVYNPTLQGGLAYCLEPYLWCKKQKISFVLSSSFESDIGLGHIASMTHRLGLSSPVGLGTEIYLTNYLRERPLLISQGIMKILS
ncbi:MAG TPA: o-succinylbenzoate synthase [Parachlamydiales bacterium]|nr:o-succinylbenzoate synthase [Parachlamydiales bacterium]